MKNVQQSINENIATSSAEIVAAEKKYEELTKQKDRLQAEIDQTAKEISDDEEAPSENLGEIDEYDEDAADYAACSFIDIIKCLLIAEEQIDSSHKKILREAV